MNKVAVFCGASTGFNSIYKNATEQLAEILYKNNITLVYGAGKIGLMGILADSFIKLKGNTIGIIPEFLKKEEVVHTNLTQLHITSNMSERKVEMSKLADGYIVLPGGFGTLDELFEVLTLNQLQIEQKPIGLLNINGYFNNLINQLKIMVNEGFLKNENLDLLILDDSATGLINKMQNYIPSQKTAVIKKVVK